MKCKPEAISDRNTIERIEALLKTFPVRDSDSPIDGCDAVDALIEIDMILQKCAERARRE